MTPQVATPNLVISICGPSGSGKSATAKALCEHLGEHRSVRIPADYYLVPMSEPLPDFLREPHQYDWSLLKVAVESPIGALVETPDFDFESFQRISPTGGRTFVSRPIRIIDAMYPFPLADIAVFVTAPAEVRRTRIATRDREWETRVLNRWDHLEICRNRLEGLEVRYNLQLSGQSSVDTNARRLSELVEDRIRRLQISAR